MSVKIKYDNLYVAFPVYDYEVETEMFVQYETFGKVEHRLIISPKKRLIYSKIDADGVERFYDYMTSEEVKEFTHDTSFETTSSPWKSVYCTYINGIMPLPIPSLRNDMLAAHKSKQKVVGYFIPFVEYVSEKLGIDASSLSPSYAHKLLRLMNIGAGRSFMLSFDADEANKQLTKIGYHKKTKKK